MILTAFLALGLCASSSLAHININYPLVLSILIIYAFTMLRSLRANGISRKPSRKAVPSAAVAPQQDQAHGLPRILSSHCQVTLASLSLFALPIPIAMQMGRGNLWIPLTAYEASTRP